MSAFISMMFVSYAHSILLTQTPLNFVLSNIKLYVAMSFAELNSEGILKSIFDWKNPTRSSHFLRSGGNHSVSEIQIWAFSPLPDGLKLESRKSHEICARLCTRFSCIQFYLSLPNITTHWQYFSRS